MQRFGHRSMLAVRFLVIESRYSVEQLNWRRQQLQQPNLNHVDGIARWQVVPCESHDVIGTWMDQLVAVAMACATNRTDCHACLVAATVDAVLIIVHFGRFVSDSVPNSTDCLHCSYPMMSWNSSNFCLSLCLVAVIELRSHFYSMILRRFWHRAHVEHAAQGARLNSIWFCMLNRRSWWVLKRIERKNQIEDYFVRIELREEIKWNSKEWRAKHSIRNSYLTLLWLFGVLFLFFGSMENTVIEKWTIWEG